MLHENSDMQDLPKNEQGHVYTIGRKTKEFQAAPFLAHGKVEKLFLHLNLTYHFSLLFQVAWVGNCMRKK